MGCLQSVPLPDPVAKFFHGKPMTPELQTELEAVLSDDFEGRFVGEFVPGYAKPIVLDKSKFPGALKNLQASFPNLTFAPTKSVKQKGQRLVGRAHARERRPHRRALRAPPAPREDSDVAKERQDRAFLFIR
jgi:hypothetical protein